VIKIKTQENKMSLIKTIKNNKFMSTLVTLTVLTVGLMSLVIIDQKLPPKNKKPINEEYKVVRIWGPKTNEAKGAKVNQGILEYVGKGSQYHLFYPNAPGLFTKVSYDNRADTSLTYDYITTSKIFHSNWDNYTLHLPREGNVK
jgi:hypothetical protein